VAALEFIAVANHMAKVRERNVETFKAYVALVEELQSTANKSLWFRGCGKSTHTLIPTLYRHPAKRSKDDIETLERQLMTRFRQRSIPLHPRTLVDDWDALFFMQHYGVPTRLLDWTENPFIAFYFAVNSSHFKIRKGTSAAPPSLSFSSDASIWVLDPAAWNNHALSQLSFDRGVLTPGDDPLIPYKPLTRFKEMYIHAVALYGAHNSPRIVAQRGVFTIFGQNTTPMEHAYDQAEFPPGCLLKLTLRRGNLPQMRSSILNNGITEAVVFPDLDGLAREMKREFQFDL
jgi:hypothetical protein